MSQKTILVIASHPDDEVLGCGGTIVKHVIEGDHVAIVFMTNGESSRDGASSGNITTRRKDCEEALKGTGY